ncbi:MAG: hypothetical protein ACLSA6_16075 [Holdemania massiliensis]
MTTQPIPRLITTLAVPTIISMLITSIYNMADTFSFRSWGTNATERWGLFFADGSDSGCRIYLGHRFRQLDFPAVRRHKHDEAEDRQYRLFAVIAFSLALTVFGLLYCSLMALLGATPTILPYAFMLSIFYWVRL